jgi:hypothetical protein
MALLSEKDDLTTMWRKLAWRNMGATNRCTWRLQYSLYGFSAPKSSRMSTSGPRNCPLLNPPPDVKETINVVRYTITSTTVTKKMNE